MKHTPLTTVQDTSLYFEDVRGALPEEYRYLLQYPTIKNFVSTAHDQKLDVDTITRNIVNLWEFLDWLKKKPKNEGELSPPMSPEELVRLVKDTKYSKNSADPYKWEQKLTDYRRVQKQKWKIGTSNNKCGAVTSFLSSNYVKDFKFTWESRGDPDIFAPTLQELRLIFASTTSIELRRMILFGSQTGLSEIDILQLDTRTEDHNARSMIQFDSLASQYNALKEMPWCPICKIWYSQEDAVVHKTKTGHVTEKKDATRFQSIAIVIPREKTNVRAITCLGPECIALMNWRFPDHRISSYQAPGGKPRKLQKDIKDLAIKLRMEKLRFHSFRKFFETEISKDIKDPKWVRRMMGHTQAGMAKTYWGARESNSAKAEYNRAYRRIRLLPENLIGKLATITPAEIAKVPIPELDSDAETMIRSDGY